MAKLGTDVLSAEDLESFGHIFDFSTLPVKCCRQHFTGENPPYGILGEAMETSASFEARSAPLPYPTASSARTDLCGGRSAMVVPTASVPSMFDSLRVKVPLTT